MQVGWDWASGSHDVSVVDGAGKRVDRWPLPHTEQGIASTLTRLRAYGEPARLPVAIETTRGLVVDRLRAAGHPVVPVHPNAFHAVRPRWGAARAKTDAGDSFKLADYLRTDGHLLTALAPTDPATLEIQALTRARAGQVEARVAATNQLAALLSAHWPGPAEVFSRLDCPIALAFLERYPSPQAAARVGPSRMAAFLRRHGYSGRKTPEELLTRLRAAPASASRLSAEVIAQLVYAQVKQLRALLAAIANLDRAISAVLERHPWAELLAPLPRIGTTNLAQVIGEAGPLLERATSLDQLAAETGVAPVTYESGKARKVGFRLAANRRARQALVTFADNSRHTNTWAAAIYRSARARGKRHPHAVRILARAWLRVIWACWRTQRPYSPQPDATG